MTHIQDYPAYAAELFNLLDKYLVKDLGTLVDDIPPKPEGGGVGYPALQTVVAGMELLGIILSGQTQSQAFAHCWNNHLCKLLPKYNRPGLREIFSQVIRNGTAHFFLVKAGVTVSKDGNNHLAQVSYYGTVALNVDVKVLKEDFLLVYDEVKKLVLGNPATFQTGLDAFNGQMNDANNQVQKFFLADPTAATTVFPSSSTTHGASIPMQLTMTSTSGTVNLGGATVTTPPSSKP